MTPETDEDTCFTGKVHLAINFNVLLFKSEFLLEYCCFTMLCPKATQKCKRTQIFSNLCDPGPHSVQEQQWAIWLMSGQAGLGAELFLAPDSYGENVNPSCSKCPFNNLELFKKKMKRI